MNSAREIADERLARGEIDIEHYRKLLEVIGDATAPSPNPIQAPTGSATTRSRPKSLPSKATAVIFAAIFSFFCIQTIQNASFIYLLNESFAYRNAIGLLAGLAIIGRLAYRPLASFWRQLGVMIAILSVYVVHAALSWHYGF